MRKKRFLIALLMSIAFVWIGSVVMAQPSGREGLKTPIFEFGLIGDLPYNAEQEAKFPNLVREMNAANLAFVVHDGDIKSGSTLCSDELFLQRRELYNTFAEPFILVPGDNEWTDCHRANNGGYDPLERLAKLREVFYQGNTSLGQRNLRLTRQSENPQYAKFRENVRWSYGNVLFVGLNVPGSNNNFGRTPEADAEYRERNAAVLSWMREAFVLAQRENHKAVMLIIQANPNFELAPTNAERTGFNDFLAALETETLQFKKPVVLVHGDSHYFRMDKPLINARTGRRVENFTRVETFGSPDVHWLRARVDFRDPNIFRFDQEIVDDNIVNF
jgi:hypothetical protein